MSESIETRVFRTVATVFGVAEESVSMETSMDDIETWDSFNILNLMMALESEFVVSISAEEAAGLFSVEAILEIVKPRLEGA